MLIADMMDTIAAHLGAIDAVAPTWGLSLVFAFMAVESSFIPFPSEVVMIPAGFLAARGRLGIESCPLALVVAIAVGVAGSIAGAYVNYYLAMKAGKPFLEKYGKYFFIKKPALDRACEVFNQYGSATTFVCRLVPVIRQLISIPAGISRMPLGPFTAFTALGAGIWTAILTATGYWLGRSSGDMDYTALVRRGKELATSHLPLVIICAVALVAVYYFASKLVMGGSKKKQSAKDSSSSNDADGCGAAKAMVTLFVAVVALNALAESEPSRWRIADGNRRIEWNVAEDRRLPHGDSIEMSGRYASLIFSYNVSENGELSLKRQLVWPMYRKAPNNTHGSFTYTFGEGKTPQLLMNGRPCGERPKMIALDGVWRGESVSTSQTLRIVRHVFPSVHHPESIDTVDVTNSGDRECTVGFTKDFVDYALGCTGRYEVRAQAFPAGERTLKPGETASWTLRFSVRCVNEEDWECDGKDELDQRSKRIEELTAPCVLETGIPELDAMFHFCKIRAGESIFMTHGGPMHCPGGGSYYAATWCNDQVEYAGPWFAFTGDQDCLEASQNAYLHYIPFMGPRYEPIPSSVIAEGFDYWNGAGDRGDAAMYAYGATRFAMAYGNRTTAEWLLPGIRWSLEYCRRNLNKEGVVKSDCDELERRLPAGDANLCTSSLYYDALRHAAMLEREIGDAKRAAEYEKEATRLEAAIESHFGRKVSGFETYRYYDGCKVLRSWIGIPLCMGIYRRAEATTDALFSPALWTRKGMLCAEGDKKGVTWDRSLLYALRGVFAAGHGDRVMDKFLTYSRTRLVGEHVPYPVEEGRLCRHLSAESALFCRIVTEGMFGIEPTGLGTFNVNARLPKGVKKMALRDVRAFGRRFSIFVTEDGTKIEDIPGKAGK